MLGEGVTPQRDAAHNIVKRKTNTNSMAIIGRPTGTTVVRIRIVYPQRFDALVGESAFGRKSRQAILEIELHTGCRAGFSCHLVELAEFAAEQQVPAVASASSGYCAADAW